MLWESPHLSSDLAAKRVMCCPLQALSQLRPSAEAQEKPARVELGDPPDPAAPDMAEPRLAIDCHILLAASMPEQAPCSACALFSVPRHSGRQPQQSGYMTLNTTARVAKLCSATCPLWCTCLPRRLPSPREVPETSLSLMNSIVTAVRSSITAMGRRMGVGLPPVLRKVLDSELCKVNLEELLGCTMSMQRGMGVGLTLVLRKALDGGAAGT